MRRVARAPAPHTLAAGCSDPQEQAQSGSSGTCAQHTGAATRRQQHAGVRKRQTTLRRRAQYRGPRPAGTGTPVRAACSSPAMSHQRPRRDCRRPASTIAYKIWRPKAPGRRPNHCFLSSRSSHLNRCTCVHHNAARDRRRGLSVETGRRERGAGDRGQRQDRDAWDLTVGRQAAMPGAARGRHRASIDGQPPRGDPGRSGTPAPAICCGPLPAASASSALTDMKLGACIARGLRRHLRAAEGQPPPR